MPTPAGIGWRHPHYRELLETRPALGFVEVHSENFFGEGGAALALLRQAREHYPVSLHGVALSLGSAAVIDGAHLEQLARLVRRIEPVRVSDHACFARGPLARRSAHAADLLPLPFNAAALAVLAANVQRVQEKLRRPLLVENLSAYLTFAGADREEPEFLAELARRTGCQLLVDVNNIYVNALNAGAEDPIADCRRWLDRIPLGCVGEIHVAGHRVLEDALPAGRAPAEQPSRREANRAERGVSGRFAIDDHGSRTCDAVWQVYRHAIECFGEVPTLVEWDTDLPALEVLLDEAAIAARVAASALQRERAA